MKTKGEAHDTLSLMFQSESVPPLIVTDSLKKQTLASPARNSMTLAVRKGPQNPTLLARTLPNERSRNTRKEPVGNCSLPTHPGDSGTIAWNMRLMYNHI